ncbi:MAG: hypothetical protein HXS52_08455 [Theionarchaea archaeon]|nr:hypothetical protein [Theionarchaea archaeon]MBU7037949.1 hypothetical protein [Theionarchaea archaeon]
MINRESTSLSAFFLGLKRDTRGVQQVFIFPKSQEKDESLFHRNLRYLILALSDRISLQQIWVETTHSSIVVRVTRHFVLGAVLNEKANLALVSALTGRIASKVDSYFDSFRRTDTRILENRIQDRIDETMASSRSTGTSRLELQVDGLSISGTVVVTVPSQEEVSTMKERIQGIVEEEVPFFCENKVSVDIKTEIALFRIRGLTRQTLSKVIQRIQGM